MSEFSKSWLFIEHLKMNFCSNNFSFYSNIFFLFTLTKKRIIFNVEINWSLSEGGNNAQFFDLNRAGRTAWFTAYNFKSVFALRWRRRVFDRLEFNTILLPLSTSSDIALGHFSYSFLNVRFYFTCLSPLLLYSFLVDVFLFFFLFPLLDIFIFYDDILSLEFFLHTFLTFFIFFYYFCKSLFAFLSCPLFIVWFCFSHIFWHRQSKSILSH